MPCGAKPRHQFNRPGWQCDGTGLVRLMFGPDDIPVVGPEERLGEIMTQRGSEAYSPQPFAGGDHYHVVIEIRGL